MESSFRSTSERSALGTWGETLHSTVEQQYVPHLNNTNIRASGGSFKDVKSLAGVVEGGGGSSEGWGMKGGEQREGGGSVSRNLPPSMGSSFRSTSEHTARCVASCCSLLQCVAISN